MIYMKASALPLPETVERIGTLIRGMMAFWKDAHGWAPIDAAELLSKSMLEWQSSLAEQLSGWCGPLSDGQLILAWTNLGALVEGQMKLLLSVYYQEYLVDTLAIKNGRTGNTVDPDGVTLEPLIVFFKKRIWSQQEDWEPWVRTVQRRRNAIHAFKENSIGSAEELHAALRTLLEFVRFINGRLPYPDGYYAPTEC
ncbi:hypothetical protein [Pseudomonas poae]|uniref:MAE-28990/MAE-18760-like HEPN domain-containing protein n=1 Tax=Pseudomonas poae TaxID=200451 RepID=A0ABY0S909_9PSED|nr:hypothetical protein [Pseudomonas poae]KRP49839.1 hypothetical protein TU75_15190 [Pseudomonas poae]SDO93367.1 hypothetical protein SAMN04490208_5466 [Pseudomonas poae]